MGKEGEKEMEDLKKERQMGMEDLKKERQRK